jgi:predicted nucleotidyltransferase
MLAVAILRTVKYFDSQEHALSLLDISKFLLKIPGLEDRPYSLREILIELESTLKDEVEEKSGFYFLKGREELVKKRLENYLYASPRLKRARKFLPFVRHLPFIEGVAMGGSEALSNSRRESDIDIFVLTTKGRTYLARVFFTAYFQILGMRRHGKHIANRFCLNHYAEEGKYLNEDHNLYTAVEYASFIPFFGGDKIYKFHMKNQDWIKQYLAQPLFVEVKTPPASGIKRGMEFLINILSGDRLENFAKKWQKKRIKPEEGIIVLDDELSLHPKSKGLQVLNRSSLAN